MRYVGWTLFLAVVGGARCGTEAAAAEWQPAKGPLMTRWAKDVSPHKVHPEYPRPQMVRQDWMNLNGLWQLAFAKAGEAPPIGKDLPERILVPFPVESALSGVMKRADRLWYRRTFDVPSTAAWKDKRVLLHFGAVDWETVVYVNGKKSGEHRGGYDAFSFDVTDALAKSGPQEIVVGVFDPTNSGKQPRGKQVNNPGGIMYTPTTGIWQTVWLEPVPKMYIESLKLIADLDKQEVEVTVHLKHAAADEAIAVAVYPPGLDATDRRVNFKPYVAHGKPGQPIRVAVHANANDLWSPDNPALYTVYVNAVHSAHDPADEARVIVDDSVRSYLGMRKIEVAKDAAGVPRIKLNGKVVFQVGPLDQGFWPDGLYAAPTDEALKYDIEMTKKLGFNCTRKHVKVEPERWYYWCDKLGLLVWQDMPSGDASVAPGRGEVKRTAEATKQFESELKTMIDRLHNHPSIVMWVVFNEGWGQYDTVKLTEWTKKYDPTRLANCASGWNDFPAGDVIDVHSYPGPGAPKGDGKRAGVLGEFGGLGLGIDGHTWTQKTWGYQGTKSQDELTARYEQLLRGAYELRGTAGLNAAIYTQITDVETEANGLLTYDRAILKVDLARAAAANRGRFPQIKTVVADSRREGQPWRMTLKEPAADWIKPDFDDAAWTKATGGFGTKGTPGAAVGAEWSGKDIWLRREFELPDDVVAADQRARILLSIHHDEDAEVYVNGALAVKAPGYTTGYTLLPMSAEGRAALRSGKNVLAVHCRQTAGGQYIDVGLVRTVPLER